MLCRKESGVWGKLVIVMEGYPPWELGGIIGRPELFEVRLSCVWSGRPCAVELLSWRVC